MTRDDNHLHETLGGLKARVAVLEKATEKNTTNFSWALKGVAVGAIALIINLLIWVFDKAVP